MAIDMTVRFDCNMDMLPTNLHNTLVLIRFRFSFWRPTRCLFFFQLAESGIVRTWMCLLKKMNATGPRASC